MRTGALIVALSFALSLSAGDGFAAKKAKAKPAPKKEMADPTAVIDTSAGKIKVKLFKSRSPKTVENFIGLATGKKEWTDPSGKKVKGKPLYNGTIFHRVIPGFMIQGGDPQGNGRGGPGYAFDDETKPSDDFDHPGILAMANSGPNTNGSQFFITVAKASWLNGHYSIFGEVTDGMDVVEKIVSGARGPDDRPNDPVTIKEITVSGDEPAAKPSGKAQAAPKGKKAAKAKPGKAAKPSGDGD